MTTAADDNEKDKEREGKGRVGGAGAFGTDRTSIAFSVDATRLKEIMANWRQLNMGEAISAVAEFFGEGVARASAHMVVTFDVVTQAAKAGYAIMTKFCIFGQDVAWATRERTREATTVMRRKYGINIKVKRGGQTVTVPNPQIT